MKKPTAADLAAKYRIVRKYHCNVCDLKPEQIALVRACRNEQQMSYRSIVLVIKGEFGTQASERGVLNHFTNHESRA